MLQNEVEDLCVSVKRLQTEQQVRLDRVRVGDRVVCHATEAKVDVHCVSGFVTRPRRLLLGLCALQCRLDNASAAAAIAAGATGATRCTARG